MTVSGTKGQNLPRTIVTEIKPDAPASAGDVKLLPGPGQTTASKAASESSEYNPAPTDLVVSEQAMESRWSTAFPDILRSLEHALGGLEKHTSRIDKNSDTIIVGPTAFGQALSATGLRKSVGEAIQRLDALAEAGGIPPLKVPWNVSSENRAKVFHFATKYGLPFADVVGKLLKGMGEGGLDGALETLGKVLKEGGAKLGEQLALGAKTAGIGRVVAAAAGGLEVEQIVRLAPAVDDLFKNLTSTSASPQEKGLSALAFACSVVAVIPAVPFHGLIGMAGQFVGDGVTRKVQAREDEKRAEESGAENAAGPAQTSADDDSAKKV